jgi:hypothetical protein
MTTTARDRLRGRLPAILLMAFIACGKSDQPQPPSAPSPAPTPTPTPPPATYTIAGAVTATNDGHPLAGATVTLGSSSTTTDGSGRYSFTVPAGSPSMPYSISGGTLLSHAGSLSATASRSVGLDAIVQDASFDLSFYRDLVRDQSSGGALQPLRRWTTNPNLYLRTVDSTTGRAVEPEVLALVTDWAQRAVTLWSGGQLRVGMLQSGTDDPPLTNGWIKVDFVREETAMYCGFANVGSNPGHVTLNNDRCNCGSTKVPPGTVLHEFGHAMGFWHVTDRSSIMYPQDPGGCPQPALSGAEDRHSRIAYRRLVGNTDPDNDPTDTPRLLPVVARP